MTAIAALRRFNRTYTQRVGVLEESFLGTGLPLTASRLLFEIGQCGEATVSDLRKRLGLDSGQLSRTLRRLEHDGLVETVAGSDDGRRRVARLTDRGTQAWQDLDQRSDDKAAEIVDALPSRQRDQLTQALVTADRLVRLATVQLAEVTVDHPLARTAQRAYTAELDARFGFSPGDPDAPEPAATFVVATSDDEALAYGGIRPAPTAAPDTAEIKRMWVHTDWRGTGLGTRMLAYLETIAAERGYRRIVLDTNGELTEAIALYERSGYRRIERYNDNPDAELFYAKELS